MKRFNSPPPVIDVNMQKHYAFYEESTKLTVCEDFDTSMKIRYGAICEINAKSKKFKFLSF